MQLRRCTEGREEEEEEGITDFVHFIKLFTADRERDRSNSG